MKSSRPLFKACLAVASSAMVLFTAAAFAQSYPNKSIKLIVPFPAGGATDIVSRVIAQQLGTELGQSVVVDNRAGAAGVIGSEAGARAAPDGYTLLLTTSSTHSIGPLLNPKIPYSPTRDFTPIVYLAESPQVVIVPPNSPIKSIPDLIAYAKANPGKLNFGSAGTGGIPHLSTERFLAMTGTRMTHVPYKGTALAMPDLMAGRLDLMFDSISTALPHIRDGKVRALAVTSAGKSSVAPEIPPLSQFVPGYESQTWFGVFGPAGLPQPIVDKMNAALNSALKNPAVLQQLAKLGFDPVGGSPEDFRKKMASESAIWKKVIEDGNITLE
ncbi:MAG: tripartite tricarboxylate transporter substrate binding protein [Burkholderiaceae bacterium]|jgi:tripartite-type tricarboxylate transporter receptor subunit TctC|nr:tripartite tricarboxylate transporter substrate binding protein [Burkholderiaceae bacterium]